MIKLIGILKEAKQAGILYHYTDIVSILKIMNDMKLKDIDYNNYDF